MNLPSQLFVCLLLFNSNGFLILRDGFVSANDFPLEFGKNIAHDVFDLFKLKANFLEDIFHHKKPIEPEPTCFKPSKIKDTKTSIVRSVITATSEFCKFKKPLTFFTALEETSLVNATENSLKVTILNPVTVATLTGGVLGNDLFQLHEYLFAWEINPCNTTLQGQVIYFNTKYGSFEKAMECHAHDGIAIISFPILTEGDYSNPNFDIFSEFLQTETHTKAPGGCPTIESKFTYTWFVNFPVDSIYHTYKLPYFDANTGKKTTAVIIEMPLNPRDNYISKYQFQKTFGKLSSSSGQVFQGADKSSQVESQKGIVVLFIPA